jgi:REP element-mobilizing transposase RayT
VNAGRAVPRVECPVARRRRGGRHARVPVGAVPAATRGVRGGHGTRSVSDGSAASRHARVPVGAVPVATRGYRWAGCRPPRGCWSARNPGRGSSDITGMSVPLAFLLTFRCYGTWLHGDPRGSVDRHTNRPGTPHLPPDPRRVGAARHRLAQPPFTLSDAARVVVADALRSVCAHRGWDAHALAVQPTHVHLVVTGDLLPATALGQLKAWATRRLIDAALVPRGRRVWSHHGSTRWLWRPEHVQRACEYVDDPHHVPLVGC